MAETPRDRYSRDSRPISRDSGNLPASSSRSQSPEMSAAYRKTGGTSARNGASSRGGQSSSRRSGQFSSTEASGRRNSERVARGSSRTQTTSAAPARGQSSSRGNRNAGRGASSQTASRNSGRFSATPQSKAVYAKPKKKFNPLFVIIPLIVIIIAIVAVLFTVGPLKNVFSGSSNNETTPTTVTSDESRVSFTALGDNLPDDDIGYDADARSGTSGDGSYDYSNLFANISSYLKASDIALMTQETVCAGDKIGPQDYETFNACDQLADAAVNAGFNVIAMAGNHIYDWGESGVLHNASLWESKGVTTLGSHSSSDAHTVEIVEKNGIKFAFLDYTYGVNGRKSSDIPWWQVRYLSEDNVRADVSKAEESSPDVIIAVVHWGIEKETTQSADQERYAQLFADLGVSMVIGSHPHVIQPMTWITGTNGNNCLVAYSLGNFTSNFQNYGDITQLGGMIQCDFVKTKSGVVSIENLKWVGIVNHNQAGNYTTYALQDYTAEIAATQPYFAHLEDPISFCKQQFAAIVNALGNSFIIPGISEEETSADSSRILKGAA